MEKEETLKKDDKGEFILQSEFYIVVECTKKSEARGINEIPVELIKNEEDVMKTKLYEIYQRGTKINYFKHGLDLMLPKKKGIMSCEEHRTINLTFHVSKILCRAKKTRIESKINLNLGNDQFGFRKDIGTRKTILSMRIFIEKQIQVNRDILIAFVDLKKALNDVNWDNIFNTLKGL